MHFILTGIIELLDYLIFQQLFTNSNYYSTQLGARNENIFFSLNKYLCLLRNFPIFVITGESNQTCIFLYLDNYNLKKG